MLTGVRGEGMVMNTAAEQHTHKYNNIARYSRYAYLQVEICEEF